MDIEIVIAKANMSNVYLSPGKDNYPAKIYVDIQTASSVIRVVIEGYTLQALQGVALEPVYIQGELKSRRFGKDQHLTLVRPVIRRLIPPTKNGESAELVTEPEIDLAGAYHEPMSQPEG